MHLKTFLFIFYSNKKKVDCCNNVVTISNFRLVPTGTGKKSSSSTRDAPVAPFLKPSQIRELSMSSRRRISSHTCFVSPAATLARWWGSTSFQKSPKVIEYLLIRAFLNSARSTTGTCAGPPSLYLLLTSHTAWRHSSIRCFGGWKNSPSLPRKSAWKFRLRHVYKSVSFRCFIYRRIIWLIQGWIWVRTGIHPTHTMQPIWFGNDGTTKSGSIAFLKLCFHGLLLRHKSWEQ